MSAILPTSQVIVYSARDSIVSLHLIPGAQIQSKFGIFKHDKMIGMKFGSKMKSDNGKGFVYLLKPTPELWTLALPHRTQILYLPDIAFITSYLNVKPGTKIIEAGTGSGSFSHSLARSVGSDGKVYSFEFHEERYQKALGEFKEHGLEGVIQLKHQNVYEDGFELVDEVDSVFLDLPAPWEAMHHAKLALRKDRASKICCFSPCIEQVLKTVTALTESGFSDITTYETLARSQDPTLFSAPSIQTAITRIEAVEAKRAVRRDGQIEEARLKREDKKRWREEEEAEPLLDKEGNVLPRVFKKTVRERVIREDSDSPAPVQKEVSFKASGQHRGHTSYLTFATLLPATKLTKIEKVEIAVEI